MRTEQVTFHSNGARIAGLFHAPDETEGPLATVVQGPGWLGLKDAAMYDRYHSALTEAGIAVLIFDYRGSGDSEGPRDVVSPSRQLEDLRNAVTYLCTRNDVDADRLGAFGSGGTGGGNVFLLAAADKRIRAVVSQVPVADGEDWLHRMRPEHEWLEYLRMLDEDRRMRVLTGRGRLVNPREEIMVATPERRATSVKKDVDQRTPSHVSLSSADEILAYRPIEAARGLDVPALIIGVEEDATTPTDHAVSLFEALRGPRRLVLQRHTTHYGAYGRYGEVIAPMIVDWLREHLVNGGIVVRTADGTTEFKSYLD